MNEKLFNSKHKSKLDNPKRVAMLEPVETLSKFELKNGDVSADVGCGTGIFTFPMAKVTSSKVYAIDLSSEMLTSVKEKITNEDIELVQSSLEGLVIDDESVDFTLLSMVLHEVDHLNDFTKELARITKPGGKLAIIEWIYKETKMGPKLDHRLSVNQIMEATNDSFILKNEFKISDAFVGILLERNN